MTHQGSKRRRHVHFRPNATRKYILITVGDKIVNYTSYFSNGRASGSAQQQEAQGIVALTDLKSGLANGRSPVRMGVMKGVGRGLPPH